MEEGGRGVCKFCECGDCERMWLNLWEGGGGKEGEGEEEENEEEEEGEAPTLSSEFFICINMKAGELLSVFGGWGASIKL